MREKFIQSIIWAHTWLGLVFGWLLFGILLSGAIAEFGTEINFWATPELPARLDMTRPEIVQSTQNGIDYLQKTFPDARKWIIKLPTEREPFLRFYITDRDGKALTYHMNPKTGEIVTHPLSGASDFFYSYHTQLLIGHNGGHPSGFGLFVVGAAGIVMMMACIGGVIIHKKRIFKDYFTFRPESSRARSWQDAHNILGVLPLPFHFIMAYTGLVILFWQYIPAPIQVFYNGSTAAFHRDFNQDMPPVGASSAAAALLPIAPLIEKAESYIGAGKTAHIDIRNPGLANSVVAFWREQTDRLETRAQKVWIGGATGEVLGTSKPEPPAMWAYTRIAGVHYNEWGGALKRWAYFLCGLAGAATVACGLIVFTVKRRNSASSQPIFHRIFNSLNIAAVAGFSIACVAYLWAERLIPYSLPARDFVTAKIFLVVWILTLLHAAIQSPRKAWVQQLAACMILCVTLPFTGILVDRDLLRTVSEGDWIRAGVDLTAIGLGVAIGFGLWLLYRSDTSSLRAQEPALAATSRKVRFFPS
jgi:uncharacterized iron-regulated membrane protein